MGTKTPEQIEQEFSELQGKHDTLAQTVSQREKENAELKSKLLGAEIKEFCESPGMAKKITPALRPHVTQIYSDLVNNPEEFEFSEGEGDQAKKVKSTRLESFKKILSSLPDAVEFGEHASKGKAAGAGTNVDVSEFSEMNVDEESMELHKKALAIQKDKSVTYAEAVQLARK